jgi:hypothetical protein
MLTDSHQRQVRPVFSYWTTDDQSLLTQAKSEWQAEFPEFKIFGDNDVVPLIERYFPGRTELFKAIRIPTAKSDIARQLLLYEFGGLYIDCHCGIRDADQIRHLLLSLEKVELIFIDRRQSVQPRHPEEHFVLSTIVFSRPRSELIFSICRQAFSNLHWHRKHERENGKTPYSIHQLGGPALINAIVFQPGSFNRDIRQDYEGRILIIPEEAAPIQRGRHRTYGEAGQHWSEREQIEPLFEI